jgi:hypothetical protein
VELCSDGGCFVIRADDPAAYHQLQTARTVKQKGPMQRQFDRPTGRQQTVGLKKHTATTDVESPARTEALHPSVFNQPILDLQSNRIPAFGTPVTAFLCW